MYITIDGLRVRYEMTPGEGRPLLFLHGWGCSLDIFAATAAAFSGRKVVMFDFPGFGESDVPPAAFTVYDYAGLTEKLMFFLGLWRPDIIAHSFGARVALVLAARGKVGRLLVTGGAGMRPRRGIRYALRVLRYKFLKSLGRTDEKAGSNDYRALSAPMRRVFVSVVNTHLEGILDKITCPVLLVWGSRDRETPPYMARRMKRKIADCGLVFVSDAGHFVFLDRPEAFGRVARAFLGEEEK